MAKSFLSVLQRIFFILLIAFPVLALSGAATFWFILDSPSDIKDVQTANITIEKGSNIFTVSKELEDLGLVKNSWYISWRFRILSRLDRIPPLQSGRFALEYGQKPSEILKSLTSPDGAQRVYTLLVIPPGLTATQIAKRIEQDGLARSEDVIKAVKNLATEYPVKANPEGLQGYLFPDTYKIETPVESGIKNAGISVNLAEAIVRIMANNFFRQLDNIDPGWETLTKAQLHEKVTLASIVEREYRRPEEAPKIAAVFNNRIQEGMRLQSCATVVYTIEETDLGKPYRGEYLKFNRRIFERYLEIPSDYNTYYHTGLPPGPISSPGRTALEAAFFPSDIDALYFVVKDPEAGSHTFSRNYEDHLAARAAYLNQFVIKD